MKLNIAGTVHVHQVIYLAQAYAVLDTRTLLEKNRSLDGCLGNMKLVGRSGIQLCIHQARCLPVLLVHMTFA